MTIAYFCIPSIDLEVIDIAYRSTITLDRALFSIHQLVFFRFP